jgi:preprotein translocase subunit SecA
MTGTAVTEAGELASNKLDVVEIPTNRGQAREDKEFIYKTTREKFNAVIEDVTALSNAGRPVLMEQLQLIFRNY